MLRTVPTPAWLLALLAIAACDSSTDPRPGASNTPVSFSREITLPDLHDQLTTGTARVQVRVMPGGLVAREVQIQGSDERAHREQLRGRVSAIAATGDQGTVTLELGGLQIGFTSSTRFRPDDGDDGGGSSVSGSSGDDGSGAGDGSGGDIALADFVARVQAELAAGGHPAVKARREPPAEPQAPDNATFTASELELDHEADRPVIDLNVTAANLVTNQTPPPDGWLKVLGLMIELRVSEGLTRLEAELPDVEGEREFEGTVRSVDVTAGSVTLENGTLVKIVAGTEVEPKEGDGDEHLASLADVQAALAAGTPVKAEGEAMVESASPLTLVAIRIEFEADHAGEDHP